MARAQPHSRAATSLLVGDEGIGKSLFWTWLAGHITNGTPSDDFGIPARAPQDVLVIVTEDEWSTTVRPRLEIVGADLNRITVVCADADGSGASVLPRDMHVLTASTIRPALIVIVPEKANSAGKVDATRFQITASNYFAPTSDEDGCVPQLTPLGDSGQTMRKHLADAHAEVTGEDGEDERAMP
ncbi:AAA family ATPase [Rhodococcoides fascians]|uniref:AAA family ATPase n=1 Tax=Rhodococcoides fascians TaxID=1828 RepID=UPI00050C6DF1